MSTCSVSPCAPAGPAAPPPTTHQENGPMLATHEEGTLRGRTATPLCVDLDGTLIQGDLLHEACVALLRHDPLRSALLPVWLLRGKAYLKERLAEHVTLDA